MDSSTIATVTRMAATRRGSIMANKIKNVVNNDQGTRGGTVCSGMVAVRGHAHYDSRQPLCGRQDGQSEDCPFNLLEFIYTYEWVCA